MSRILISILFCFILHLNALAGEGEYAVSKINPALIKNANAVLRLEESNFEIVNPGKAFYKYHYVITILNENGDVWSDFSEYYDKYRKIESIEGILYNATGAVVKKIKTKDASDLSGVSEISLIDDNRVKHHNFYQRAYPYTVEYSVEIQYNSTLFFPSWTPQPKDNLSVEKSIMNIISPIAYAFRYKEFNYSGTGVKRTEGNKTVTTWSVKDLPAITKEAFSPLWHEITTMVIFGPSDFEVDDYKGNMNSWLDFGKFVYTLKQDRDVLPEEIKKEVHRLADNIQDPVKKISILYNYFQKNTRYISIQLGIGGWQPFDAKFVVTKAYGDCKALSNYMYSLLKEAGIPSYYTLVRAGQNSQYITLDFPSQQFNHVILCIPFPKDTVWLECTSQTQSPGYMGSFTGNRPALLITQEGGKLVNTPSYTINDNLQFRKINAVLDEEGNLKTHVQTFYKGILQDELQMMINMLSRDKVKEHLHEELDFATYQVNDFQYKETKNTVPEIEETLDIVADNYATISGKRLFIVPDIMNRSNRKLPVDEQRKYDLVFSVEYRETDSAEIELPAGYRAEALPQDVILDTRFGKYYCSVKMNGKKLSYFRKFEKFSGRFKPADYTEVVKFFDAIYKADRNKVVLVKNGL